MAFAWLLSILAAAAVLFAVLWVPHTQSVNSRFQFRLADMISLAVMLQAEMAIFAAVNSLEGPEQHGDFSSLLVGALGLNVVILCYWVVCIRELERLEVKSGWRRVIFSVFLLPLTLIFASYATVLTFVGTKDLWPQFLAAAWPTSYQNLGVGYTPFDQQIAYICGGLASTCGITTLLRLAHRRLLFP